MKLNEILTNHFTIYIREEDEQYRQHGPQLYHRLDATKLVDKLSPFWKPRAIIVETSTFTVWNGELNSGE